MPLSGTQIEETFACSNVEVKSVISSIIKLNLNNDHNRKLIISNINKLLGISKTRTDGLEILRTILPACSFETSENCLKWINLCLIQQPIDIYKESKLLTLAALIEYSPKDQEFNKRFVADYLSKIVDSCINATLNNIYEVEVALDCLNMCMKYFASSVLPFKNKTEAFLLKLLDLENEDIIEKAGFSFLLLQQVGGAGLDGINHIKNFSTQFRKLCATIHSLYDRFFENITEVENIDALDESIFLFEDVQYDSQKMMHVTARRLNNCVKFLMIMIQKKFPVVKETKPKELLDVIIRGMSVHYCVSNDELPMNTYHFSLLLNDVQTQLLQLMRLSIVWYQTHLFPFSFTVSKLLVDCLNRSQKCDCFSVDNIYKEATYKTLISWLQISKCSINEHFQNHLIKCILEDIRPVKSQVKLSIKNTQGLSLKAKAKAINEKIIASGQNSKIQNSSAATVEFEENSCKLALKALKYLFLTTSLDIKENILHDLYSVVFKTLLNIQTNKIVHPYKSNDCQALLYEVIVAFYEHETLALFPPLNLTIQLLHHGANGPNSFICTTCEYGLSMLEKLCQPVCPSLYMPVNSPKLNGEATIEFKLPGDNGFPESDASMEIGEISNQNSEGLNDSESRIVILSNEVIHPAKFNFDAPTFDSNEAKTLNAYDVDSNANTTDENAENNSSSEVICIVEEDNDEITLQSNFHENNPDELDVVSLQETIVEANKINEAIEVDDSSENSFEKDTVEFALPPPAKKQKTAEDFNVNLDDSFVDQVIDY